MYEQLVTRIAEQLALPRPIKAQTQRQLSRHCSDESTETAKFLLSATDLLEEDELDIVFAAQFTPDCDDQIAVSELLYHWRPSEEEISRITDDACRHTHHAIVVLPGEVEAPLPLHEVMADRFIRLLALQRAPNHAALRPCVRSCLAVCGRWARPFCGSAALKPHGSRGSSPSSSTWCAATPWTRPCWRPQPNSSPPPRALIRPRCFGQPANTSRPPAVSWPTPEAVEPTGRLTWPNTIITAAKGKWTRIC